jgi:hypothetical protein
MWQPLSRRTFLRRAVALFGGIVAAASTPFSALATPIPSTRPYFVLDPEHGAGGACPAGSEDRHAFGGTCHGCHACHSHGANKLFATPEAADALRAHRHCKCLVTVGGSLPLATWTALFGPAIRPRVLSADRRHLRTRKILALN